MTKNNAQVFYTTNGYAEFQAEATLNSYTGVSNQLTGLINLSSKKVEFSLPIKSLDTGIGKRNRDMHELLEVDKYPLATFEGEIVSAFDANSIEEQNVAVSGNFTLHGVTKPLTVRGTLQKNNIILKVEASWDLFITEFNIKPPRFLLNKVRDKHRIIVRADLVKQE